MPNTRKKLIKLLEEIACRTDDERCRKCVEQDCVRCAYENVADHLIANGVTVQQWIPVTERLPNPFVHVLVFRDGKIQIDYHEERGWFAHDFGKRVTHWMPLPEPPKEGSV